MVEERKPKRSKLAEIIGTILLCTVPPAIGIPVAAKIHYNKETHNNSEVFSTGMEVHEFTGFTDSYFRYFRFRDGAEQIEFHISSLDLLSGRWSFPSGLAIFRTYDGGDKVQEIKVESLTMIRERDYRRFLGTFNVADAVLGEFRKVAEYRRLHGMTYPEDKPISSKDMTL